MTRQILSALLAAVAFVPAVAQAQEGVGDDGRSQRGQREPRGEGAGGNREQPRQFGGERNEGRAQDNGQRFTPAPQQQQQAPQPQFQAPSRPQQPFQPQQQPQRPQPPQQPQPQFQGQPQRGQQSFQQPQFRGQPDRGDPGRPGWDGRGPNGNGGFAPPPPVNRPAPPPTGYGIRQGGGAPLWNGDRSGRAPNFNFPRNNGAWNRQWRGDQRYDWQRFRSDNRSAFRLPRYYAPRGWGYGYRRFGIGITLNALLFAPDYWIDDPYEYRLPPAYGPYRWVRYYNDALLVDVRSGVVVDTIYDIFW